MFTERESQTSPTENPSSLRWAISGTHQQHSSKYFKNYSCIIIKRRKKVRERRSLPSTWVQAYDGLQYPYIGIQAKIDAQHVSKPRAVRLHLPATHKGASGCKVAQAEAPILPNTFSKMILARLRFFFYDPPANTRKGYWYIWIITHGFLFMWMFMLQ